MEVTSKMLQEIEEELRDLKIKKYVDTIKSQGWVPLVYECLECMFHRGRHVMPKTYEYRRALTKWYREKITYIMKCWRSVQ